MSHSRKPSTRAALPRRSTKGPLDVDEVPSLSSPIVSPSLRSPETSPLATSPSIPPLEQKLQAATPLPQSPSIWEHQVEAKDMSFLLDASIYHPLSQLEVPGPFRRSFPPPPPADAAIDQSLMQLETLLSQCDYLRAAHLAGSLLTSGTVLPADTRTIFLLLAVRYSCLELSGNVLLAAQEAKALEDLSSGFYYDEYIPPESAKEVGGEDRPLPKHIMPFSLRLQALRLQSIGFSDPRRGVSALYDVALECREHIASPTTTDEARKLWVNQLEEVGIRVVNALIEMSDLDCARRTLQTLRPSESTKLATWTFRMVLLYLKMGLLNKARELIGESDLPDNEKIILDSLIAVSEERHDDAVILLAEPGLAAREGLVALAKQNLAIALLYKGEVQRSRAIIEALVDDDNSFQTLTINLATIYDLTSDRSRDMKLALINKIAAQHSTSHQPRSFTNADFKL